MDEQNFVDQMEMIIMPMKILRNPNDLDIPSIITETLTKYETLPSLKNLLEIKNSSIHGKGVFAKKNIDPNQVVSIYPCHGIINGNIGYCTKENTGDYELLHFNPHEYKIKIPKGNDIFIYGNPHIQEEGFVCHLINDSCKDVTEFKNINKHNIKMCLKYMLNSIKYDNCIFVQSEDYVYVKTTKYINKGEELFISYGYSYWCSDTKPYEISLLMKEYILSCSKSQQDFIMNLFKQLSPQPPLPSKKIKELMPYLCNPLVVNELIKGVI